MKKILLTSVLLLLSAITFAQANFRNKTIHILPESTLTITGDTNIKDFTCEFDMRRLEKEQLVQFVEKQNRLEFKNTVLRLQSAGFDCGSRAINKDFHDLIQSEEYPEILLELKEIEIKEENLAEAKVRITIAGKQNDYKIPVELISSNKERESSIQHLEGTLDLNINDYGLKPPKKLFGLIIVKEDININFHLKIRK